MKIHIKENGSSFCECGATRHGYPKKEIEQDIKNNRIDIESVCARCGNTYGNVSWYLNLKKSKS